MQFKNKYIMKDDGVVGCLDSWTYKLKKNVRYTNTNIDSLQIFVKGQGF